jgi:hypothetical protein
MSVILADLKRIAGAFDFTQNRLGVRAMFIAADSVRDNLDAETDDRGALWPALSPEYEAHKFDRVGVKPMGVLYDVMAQPAEIAGEHNVTAGSATYTFGVSHDAKVHAEWFQDPAHPGQPPREFVGLNARAVGRADATFDEEFRRAVEG